MRTVRKRDGKDASTHMSPAAIPRTSIKDVNQMLETIAIILIVLWLLGLVSSYTIGGLIHVLLVIAIVMILLRVISGKPV